MNGDDERGADRNATPWRRLRRWLTFLGTIYLGAAVIRGCVGRSYQIPSSSMAPTLVPGETAFVSKLHFGARTPTRLAVPLTDITFGPPLPPGRFPGFTRPRRGDVIAFHRPEPASGTHPTTYIKRVIGLPGDTVRIVAGDVLINGAPLDEPYTDEGPRGVETTTGVFPVGSGFTTSDFGPLRVPARGDTVRLTPTSWSRLSGVLEHGERLTPEWGENGITVDGRPAAPLVLQNDYYFVLGDARLGSIDSRSWGFLPEDEIIGHVVAAVTWAAARDRARGLHLVR